MSRSHTMRERAGREGGAAGRSWAGLYAVGATAAPHVHDAAVQDGVKELVLIIDWSRPLHVVVVVDHVREEERIVTVYKPDEDRWSVDFRVRKP